MANEAHTLDGLAALAPAPLAPLVSRALFWPALSKLPKPEYLLKGVFDRGCFGEIFGPTGSGKSFLATDLGLHVAAGWT